VVAIAIASLATHMAELFHHAVTTVAAGGVVAVFGAIWFTLNVVLPRLDAS